MPSSPPREVICPDCRRRRLIKYYSKTNRCTECENRRRSSVWDKDFIRSRVVVDDGCWVWQRSFRSDGYGQIKLRGRTFGAHQVSYSIFIGSHQGAHVHHLCGRRACVNPDHLILVALSEHGPLEAMTRRHRARSSA